MANPSNGHGRSSFWTQANALFRKNLTFQRRNKNANIFLVSFPFILCIVLFILQKVIDNALNKPKYRCGCAQVNGTTVCGVQYSTTDQALNCLIRNPTKWPALLQIPAPEYRAARANFINSTDLPNESCRVNGSCPVTILVTGNNQSLGQNLAENMLPTSTLNSSDFYLSVANNVLGSASKPLDQNFLDPAISFGLPLYLARPVCSGNSTFSLRVPVASSTKEQEVKCVQGLRLWRNSSSVINDELYKGYRRGNPEKEINEIVAAYDFLNSNTQNFNVSVWYNATYKNASQYAAAALLRVPRSVNLVSNAFLQSLLGPSTKMLIPFVKEMPKHETRFRLDIASLLSAQFFTYVIIALFVTILVALVYERQQKLRIMMKMHGLGDGPYWLISYAYFLALSLIYMIVFVVFGSAIGLKIFTTNDYSLQFVFYFISLNLQISLAFLMAPMFTSILTARAVGFLVTFGTGLLGGFLFQFFVEDTSFPRGWIIVMELYPGFSLFRGLYEFGDYSFIGDYTGTDGMRWSNLSDSKNGMREVLIIMFVEWLIALPLAFYLDQVVSSGSGVKKHPLFFLHSFRKKSLSASRRFSLKRQGSKVLVEMEKADVAQERERVNELLLESSSSNSIICDNLRKIYPGRDGNPPKLAVKGLSLAVPRGECFGMLGPNGAGKTSFISMMTGLIDPTSGVAFIEGLDIRTQMDEIYTSMGVCPQHDLLWETLTGREHLLFYGRLKNLKGPALLQAVDESLKSVNLYNGGVGDKPAGKYSGGMKRRLSVAISLIGDPKVVYMDEPSTGLDPASRNNLWNVVKHAKQDRAIILTTHSMEEAEVLCDRIGIFVDGSLQCIGNPKELKGRYGGSFVFTMTTSQDHDSQVERMVQSLSPNAQKIYHISGTQKFEIPKHETRISNVFKAVEDAKKRFTVYAWAVADTTLEDVFIKVARDAQTSNTLA